MPPNPQNAPMPVERIIILPKSVVRSRATTGGMTIAEAINVTPSICIETTIVAAKNAGHSGDDSGNQTYRNSLAQRYLILTVFHNLSLRFGCFRHSQWRPIPKRPTQQTWFEREVVIGWESLRKEGGFIVPCQPPALSHPSL